MLLFVVVGIRCQGNHVANSLKFEAHVQISCMFDFNKNLNRGEDKPTCILDFYISEKWHNYFMDAVCN